VTITYKAATLFAKATTSALTVVIRCKADKSRMRQTHFVVKRLPKVATEMALHVLAYNLTRVVNIMGIQPLMAAIRA
jgi:hypothetical protein